MRFGAGGCRTLGHAIGDIHKLYNIVHPRPRKRRTRPTTCTCTSNKSKQLGKPQRQLAGTRKSTHRHQAVVDLRFQVGRL